MVYKYWFLLLEPIKYSSLLQADQKKKKKENQKNHQKPAGPLNELSVRRKESFVTHQGLVYNV